MQCSCGGRLADAAWCPRCLEPRPARPEAPRPAVREPSGLGRWDSSVVTFGLRGRLLLTVLLTLPLLYFLYALVPFGFVGLVTYGGVLYPRAMRDVWRRADRL